ncbi:MAG: hypothetical protein HY901_10745 [Deltaproteobacteria bacterium]|nr:hypothetical protein [Deltaproteobacteria bacterium]
MSRGRLPEAWRSLRFFLRYRGARLEAPTSTRYSNRNHGMRDCHDRTQGSGFPAAARRHDAVAPRGDRAPDARLRPRATPFRKGPVLAGPVRRLHAVTGPGARASGLGGRRIRR